MKTYVLSPVDPGSEDYDEDYPTRQTELLCLDLRKILYGLSGAVVSAPETDEDSHTNAKLQLVVDAIDNADIEIAGVSDVIASVDALTEAMEDKLDVLSVRMYDPENPGSTSIVGVLNEIMDNFVVTLMGKDGSVFKTFEQGETGEDGTSLLFTMSERIKELSDNILLTSTVPTSISVYDKVILTREGLVTEEI